MSRFTSVRKRLAPRPTIFQHTRQFRPVANTISDAIYERLTGEKGNFRRQHPTLKLRASDKVIELMRFRITDAGSKAPQAGKSFR